MREVPIHVEIVEGLLAKGGLVRIHLLSDGSLVVAGWLKGMQHDPENENIRVRYTKHGALTETVLLGYEEIENLELKKVQKMDFVPEHWVLRGAWPGQQP